MPFVTSRIVTRSGWALLAGVALMLLPQSNAVSQEIIVLDLPDATAYPGDAIVIPVTFSTLTDSVEAYTLRVSFSRPGLTSFADSPIRTEGTLTAEWDFTNPLELTQSNLTLTGVSDFNLDNLPTGIPPLTLGETLVNLVVIANCDPDTISGFTVRLDPLGLQEFSNPLGVLLQPVSFAGGTITILTTMPGDLDHSGVLDILDVVGVVNCAFRSSCPACTADLGDLDCSGEVTVLDVVRLVNHVFRNSALNTCP